MVTFHKRLSFSLHMSHHTHTRTNHIAKVNGLVYLKIEHKFIMKFTHFSLYIHLVKRRKKLKTSIWSDSDQCVFSQASLSSHICKNVDMDNSHAFSSHPKHSNSELNRAAHVDDEQRRRRKQNQGKSFSIHTTVIYVSLQIG